MSVSELRAESVRRGLGTARSRADLIQRLTDHDRAGAPEAETAEAPAETPQEETTPPSAAGPLASPGPFRKTFDAEPGGPE